MAAVPDFSAYAMENWGLIIYREVTFLYDPSESDADDKKLVARAVSHELGQQVLLSYMLLKSTNRNSYK